MSKSSDDKVPFVAVPGEFNECAVGWDKIADELQRAIARSHTEKPILVVECYPGVDESAVMNELASRLAPKLSIQAKEAYHPPKKIEEQVAPFLESDKRLERFDAGNSKRLSLVNFFDADPLWRFRRTIDELKSGLVLIVGCGASLIAWGHTLVYADLARREARQRLHENGAGNLGVDNPSAPSALKQKRAFHIDWPIIDRWKRPLIRRWDYVLDTHAPAEPKLADAADVRRGLRAAATRPFCLMPACDPDGETKGSERPLDCAFEENSLLLALGGLRIEVPAVDLLLYQPRALLGETVYARYGYEFPVRVGSQKTNGLGEPLAHGDCWREERVGSDESAGIETRRHWFSETVAHDTQGGVNVLKLVQGDEAMVESPESAFKPFAVRFAETFIVPAVVGHYNIRPHGPTVGKEIATLKAFVRIQNFGNRMP